MPKSVQHTNSLWRKSPASQRIARANSRVTDDDLEKAMSLNEDAEAHISNRDK